jgi:hypothetical protein
MASLNTYYLALVVPRNPLIFLNINSVLAVIYVNKQVSETD